MKIALLGEDLFTAAVLQSLVDKGHAVEAVICPLYQGNTEYRSLEKTARKNNIPFHHRKNVNDEETRNLLLAIGPDLIVSVHLTKILLKMIYSIAPVGAINVHPSLLPKYRGLSPQHQALLNGDPETGVTIHFIEETADTGDMIVQEKIPLSRETDVYHLQLKMLEIYKYLVPEAIGHLADKNFRPVRQNSSGASWFGPIKESDRKIDLKKAKFAVYNQIRALSKPYKGAYFNDITVWASFDPEPGTESAFLKEYPENGIYKIEDKLLIRLHDGVLLSDDFEIAIP